MGFGLAENAALTSMKVHKKAFDTLSQNVANANNEEYHVKQVQFKNSVIDGVGVGVTLGPVIRRLDEFIQAELRTNFSIQGNKEIVNDYHDRIQILLGKPGMPGTLNSAIDEFFGVLKVSTSTPEIKLQVVQKAEALAQKISDIAYGLQKLRYDADIEIYETVEYINQNINQLHDVQQHLTIMAGSDSDNTSLLDERDSVISKLAKLLDIKTYTNNNNLVYVSAHGGIPLYSVVPYEVRYSSSSSVDVFLEDLGVGDIVVVPQGTPLGDMTNASILVKGGVTGEVVTEISQGKLAGLLELRDVTLPKLIAQLDNFAIVLRDKINAVHNDGSGMPPANTLIGTTAIANTDYHQFFGKVRIGLTDNTGRPLVRADGQALNALTLDLGKLDSGVGAGSIQMQTIVDEINQYYYYDPLLAKTQLGNLEDIRIASRTSNMVANGIFDFDFELVNNSTSSALFEVTSISVYDNTATLVPGAILTSMPVTMNVLNGDRIRTDLIRADFSGGAGGPYTLRATLKVTDADGRISSGTADFVIDDTPAGGPNIMNHRYVATSVAGSDIQLVPPGSSINYAIAEIVKSDGIAAANGESGYLRIKGLRDTIGVSIAELDSIELGYTYSNGLVIPATRRGFSHFFGLNNLFADDNTNKNVASKLKVEQRIQDDPNLFSMGRLARSASYVTDQTVGDQTAKAVIVFNANPAAGSTFTVNGQTFTFVAVAGLPNEVQIGATLGDTLANLSAALGASNAFTSGTVDKALYSDNGFDTLQITYRVAGDEGNFFTFSHNLLGGAQASIDGGPFTVSNSSNLKGGTNKSINVIVNPNSYEISAGSAQVALDMIDVSITSYSFAAAGSMPALTTTLAGYAGAIISYASVASKNAKEGLEKQQLITEAFDQKLKEGSGVNLDEEMSYTVVYQNTYVASATIFATTKRLYDVLLDTMRS